MPIAVCTIRRDPHYRKEAFHRGLQRSGYSVVDSGSLVLKRADVLVTWNRSGAFGVRAADWERRGGTVVVCENGYVGHDYLGRQHYAMAIGGHNGSGKWPHGDGSRWAALNIEIKPWRANGDHLIVFMQRGIGTPLMASAPNFEAAVRSQLALFTKRQIVFSKHPGKPACDVVEQTRAELEGAHAAVTWASGRGIRALIEGIPTFYMAPHWSCEGAGCQDLSLIESPPTPDRLLAFQRMAWGQWSIAEIESGAAFDALLNQEQSEKCMDQKDAIYRENNA